MSAWLAPRAWLLWVAFAVVAAWVAKVLGGALLSRVLTRNKTAIRIEMLSVFKLKGIVVHVLVGDQQLSIRARDFYLDRLTSLRAMARALVGILNPNVAFRIPVRVSSLIVTVSPADGAHPPEERREPGRKEASRVLKRWPILQRAGLVLASYFEVTVSQGSLTLLHPLRARCEYTVKRVTCRVRKGCVSVTAAGNQATVGFLKDTTKDEAKRVANLECDWINAEAPIMSLLSCDGSCTGDVPVHVGKMVGEVVAVEALALLSDRSRGSLPSGNHSPATSLVDVLAQIVKRLTLRVDALGLVVKEAAERPAGTVSLRLLDAKCVLLLPPRAPLLAHIAEALSHIPQRSLHGSLSIKKVDCRAECGNKRVAQCEVAAVSAKVTHLPRAGDAKGGVDVTIEAEASMAECKAFPLRIEEVRETATLRKLAQLCLQTPGKSSAIASSVQVEVKVKEGLKVLISDEPWSVIGVSVAGVRVKPQGDGISVTISQPRLFSPLLPRRPESDELSYHGEFVEHCIAESVRLKVVGRSTKEEHQGMEISLSKCEVFLSDKSEELLCIVDTYHTKLAQKISGIQSKASRRVGLILSISELLVHHSTTVEVPAPSPSEDSQVCTVLCQLVCEMRSLVFKIQEASHAIEAHAGSIGLRVDQSITSSDGGESSKSKGSELRRVCIIRDVNFVLSEKEQDGSLAASPKECEMRCQMVHLDANADFVLHIEALVTDGLAFAARVRKMPIMSLVKNRESERNVPMHIRMIVGDFAVKLSQLQCETNVAMTDVSLQKGKVSAHSVRVFMDHALVARATAVTISEIVKDHSAHVRCHDVIMLVPHDIELGKFIDHLKDYIESILQGSALGKVLGAKHNFSHPQSEVKGYDRLTISLGSASLLVENPPLEAWLASHFEPLQSCSYGVHLASQATRAYISDEADADIGNLSSSQYNSLYNAQLLRYFDLCSKLNEGDLGPHKNSCEFCTKGIECLFIRKSTDVGAVDEFISRVDKSSEGVSFSSALSAEISVRFDSVSMTLCAMSKPFVELSSVHLHGEIALAKQESLQPQTVIVRIKTDSFRELSFSTPAKGTSPPTKLYTSLYVDAGKCDGLYGVAVEPYIALMARSFKTFFKRNKGTGVELKWWDELRYLWRGELSVSMKRLKAIVLGDADRSDRVENRNAVYVSMAAIKVLIWQGRIHLTCEDTTVSAAFSFTSGNALAPKVEHQKVKIFVAPFLQCDMAFRIDCPHGRDSNDHHLFQAKHLERAGPRHPHTCAHELFRAVKIDLGLRFFFSCGKRGEKTTVKTSPPLAFVGARQIKALAHIICILKDPPQGLREAFNIKPFGSTRPTSKGGLPQILNIFSLSLSSTPLRMEYCDELPGTDQRAVLDLLEFRVDMKFKYLTVVKPRNPGKRLYRKGRMIEMQISGKKLHLDIADDLKGKGRRDTLSPILKEFSAMLGGKAQDDKSERERPEFILLRCEEVDVSMKKDLADILGEAPWIIKIDGFKGMLTRFKRDVCYAVFQSVAIAISETIDTYAIDDGEVILVGDAWSSSEPEENQTHEPAVAPPSNESNPGEETKEDLLAILLKDKDRDMGILEKDTEDEPVGFSSHCFPLKNSDDGTSDPARILKYTIEIIEPQLNLESETSQGRFLLSSSNALIQGYRVQDRAGATVVASKKTEMSFRSLQVHICQMDIDPGAKVQWLTLGPNGMGVSNEALLHAIFMPCSMEVNLVETSECLDSDISVAGMELDLDSREFEISADVLSNIALSPLPKGTQGISLSLLGTDLLRIAHLDRFATAEEGREFCVLTREALEHWNSLNFRWRFQETTKGVLDTVGRMLKRDFDRVIERRKLLVRSLLKQEGQVRSKRHQQSTLIFQLEELTWKLRKDRKHFIDATLKSVLFSRVRYEDFSGSTKFEVASAKCTAKVYDKKVEKEVSYEILKFWNPSEGFEGAPFVHVYLVSGGEHQGLSVFELCDITLHPLCITLAQKTASEIQAYFFQRPLSTAERQRIWSHVSGKGRRASVIGGEGDLGPEESPAPKRREALLHGKGPSSSQGGGSRSFAHSHSHTWDGSELDALHSSATPLGKPLERLRSTSFDSFPKLSPTDSGDLTDGEEWNKSEYDILNRALLISPSLVSSPSGKQAISRGVLLHRVRFNELGLKLSFYGSVVTFSGTNVLLDTVTYHYYEGTWKGLFERFKWQILKSVLKNVAGLQTSKLRGIASYASGSSGEGGDEKEGKGEHFAEDSPSLLSKLFKKRKSLQSRYAMLDQKFENRARILFGDRYRKTETFERFLG